MKTSIFFFSGTGNSFILARSIATRLGAALIPIPRAMKQQKIQPAKRIGIVFPSYLGALFGVPLMVERFIERIPNLGDLEIFAVCNCGGYESVNALPSLHTLKTIIEKRGGKLSAGFTIRFPMNNLDYDHIPIPIERDSDTIIVRSERRIADICACIVRGKGPRHRILKNALSWLMSNAFKSIHKTVTNDLKKKAMVSTASDLSFRELIHLTDKSIVVNDGCIGCGICSKVCPAGNIKIVDGRPEFQHICEMCFACDEWCPQSAIQHWGRAKGIKYHHPDAMLEDMLSMNR